MESSSYTLAAQTREDYLAHCKRKNDTAIRSRYGALMSYLESFFRQRNALDKQKVEEVVFIPPSPELRQPLPPPLQKTPEQTGMFSRLSSWWYGVPEKRVSADELRKHYFSEQKQ